MSYPFRIEYPREMVIKTNAGDSSNSGSSTEEDFVNYMERLVKLIPTEVISVYLTVRGFWLPEETSTSLGFVDW
ncbi:MAG: hypothetical protein AAGE84_13555 [Cyanobacteria bacterium P01_G01_bin.39]